MFLFSWWEKVFFLSFFPFCPACCCVSERQGFFCALAKNAPPERFYPPAAGTLAFESTFSVLVY
jgi:hypothetical protein